jgi:hypothetical protein
LEDLGAVQRSASRRDPRHSRRRAADRRGSPRSKISLPGQRAIREPARRRLRVMKVAGEEVLALLQRRRRRRGGPRVRRKGRRYAWNSGPQTLTTLWGLIEPPRRHTSVSGPPLRLWRIPDA